MPFTLELPTEDQYSTKRSYDKVEDGSYTAIGFTFIGKDDAPPEFTLMGGDVKAMVKFVLEGDVENPPVAAVTLPQFLSIVRAFGAGEWVDSGAHEATTMTLLAGKHAIYELGNIIPITIKTKNGWVNANANTFLNPTQGAYTVQFKRAWRYDKSTSLHFEERKSKVDGWGTQYTLNFDFVIVGNESGDPSVWNGFVIQQWMNNPFHSTRVLADGTVETAGPGTGPFMVVSDRGYTKAQLNWVGFINYFTELPDDYAWPGSADSAYGVNESEFPQYPIINNALEINKAVCVGVYIPPGKAGATFNLDENILNAYNIRRAPIVNEIVPGEVISAIMMQFPDESVYFNANNTPTDEGKKWMREYLLAGDESSEVPSESIYGLANIERRVSVGDLTNKESARLLEVLSGIWNPTAVL